MFTTPKPTIDIDVIEFVYSLKLTEVDTSDPVKLRLFASSPPSFYTALSRKCVKPPSIPYSILGRLYAERPPAKDTLVRWFCHHQCAGFFVNGEKCSSCEHMGCNKCGQYRRIGDGVLGVE